MFVISGGLGFEGASPILRGQRDILRMFSVQGSCTWDEKSLESFSELAAHGTINEEVDRVAGEDGYVDEE